MTNKSTTSGFEKLSSIMRIVTPSTRVSSMLYDLEAQIKFLQASSAVPTDVKLAFGRHAINLRLAVAASMIDPNGVKPITEMLKHHQEKADYIANKYRVRFPRPSSARG